MSEQVDTVIVGGGISGLACARALQRAGRPFVLLTDRLGGRLHASAAGTNFGAAYITSDYRHTLEFVDRDFRIYMKDVFFWDGSRFITAFDRTNLGRAREMARLYRLVIAFRRRLNRFRKRAPFVCQKTLMEQDGVLRRYVEQPAEEFVREQRLERVNEIYCGPLFFSTLFAPYTETNAFYYLANLFPILLPVYALDARRAVERLTAGFTERIVMEKATSLRETDGGFEVETAAEAYAARNLVVALPNRNSDPLLPTANHARDIPYGTLHIRGARRASYKPGKTVFLREEHPARVLWPQGNGLDIAFAPDLAPDLSEYYDRYEIVDAVFWKTAIQLSRTRWRPLQPRPNLFTIGDHNIVGLEDSYLTGLFAANRIIEGGRG